ncbi:hypothetical protein Tco_1465074 [Tanacetum coccineum]
MFGEVTWLGLQLQPITVFGIASIFVGVTLYLAIETTPFLWVRRSVPRVMYDRIQSGGISYTFIFFTSILPEAIYGAVPSMVFGFASIFADLSLIYGDPKNAVLMYYVNDSFFDSRYVENSQVPLVPGSILMIKQASWSVQSLDLGFHSDFGADFFYPSSVNLQKSLNQDFEGMLILCLDPQILWSSKKSLVQSWNPLFFSGHLLQIRHLLQIASMVASLLKENAGSIGSRIDIDDQTSIMFITTIQE